MHCLAFLLKLFTLLGLSYGAAAAAAGSNLRGVKKMRCWWSIFIYFPVPWQRGWRLLSDQRVGMTAGCWLVCIDFREFSEKQEWRFLSQCANCKKCKCNLHVSLFDMPLFEVSWLVSEFLLLLVGFNVFFNCENIGTWTLEPNTETWMSKLKAFEW